MAPKIIIELGATDPLRRCGTSLPDGPPWWISGHQLHGQPSTVAERLLDQLVDAEPEREFFNQGGDGWRGFTAFLLASTTNPASVGGARGGGIGTATHETPSFTCDEDGWAVRYSFGAASSKAPSPAPRSPALPGPWRAA